MQCISEIVIISKSNNLTNSCLNDLKFLVGIETTQNFMFDAFSFQV